MVSLDHLLASIGSAVPPALLEAGVPKLDLRAGNFPPGTEKVEIKTGNRRHLQGVFVPAGPEAPVVVHLLESLGSVTFGTEPLLGYPCLWQLRDMGFSSLMVDYRGIGASGGKRSPRHMRPDARAIWMHAIERVGGNPNKIVMRALSLGTLAAACLLEEQVLPKGVLFIAPVRAETVAKNWFKKYHGPRVAFFASILGRRRPVRVDIQKVIENTRVPLLAYAPKIDYALPQKEMQFVQTALVQAGGEWVSSPFNHSGHVLEAHSVFSQEKAFLETLFPDLAPLGLQRIQSLAPNKEFSPDIRQWLRKITMDHLKTLTTEAFQALLHFDESTDASMLLQLRKETESNQVVPGIPLHRIKRAHGIPVRAVGNTWQEWTKGQWVDLDS